MTLKCILKIEFLQNLFMQIQEQVQNFAESIYVIKHTSTSPHSSIISCFG